MNGILTIRIFLMKTYNIHLRSIFTVWIEMNAKYLRLNENTLGTWKSFGYILDLDPTSLSNNQKQRCIGLAGNKTTW